MTIYLLHKKIAKIYVKVLKNVSHPLDISHKKI